MDIRPVSYFTYDGATVTGYVCQHGNDSQDCADGEMCAAVGEQMLLWHETLPRQMMVRTARRSMMIDSTQNPNLRAINDGTPV